jgi:predicted dehydrogenase
MDQRTRVGIIGTGRISHTHISALSSHCADIARIVAVADVDEVRGRQAARAAAGADYHADYRELLARDDIEFVDVLTPPGLHYEIGMAVAAAGKHVCIIKPFVLDLHDADTLIRVAEERGVKLFAGHPQRYDPALRTIAKLARSGDLGDPVRIYARSFLHHSSLEKPQNWYYNLRECGGLTIETLVHALDLMAWICGPAVRAYSEAGCYHTRERAGKLPDDQVAVIYRFANGALGVLEGAGARALGIPSFLFEVVGTQGAAWRDPEAPGTVHVSRTRAASGAIETLVSIGPVGGAPQMLREFIECVRADAPPPVTGSDGRYAVEMAWAAVSGYRSGLPVALPFDPSRYPALSGSPDTAKGVPS